MKVAVESASVVYADFSSGERIRILHVDNDAPFLAVAKHCLEEQGPFQVDSALSAKEALEKLRNADYDAVVADYQMPGKNGLELLKELRQEGIDVPFILFTCKGKEEIAIEALNSGVEQYIDKQGNAEATYEELKHIILSAVKRRRIEKRLKKSENLLSQITDNMQDLLMLTDENLIITYASSSYKVVLGYEPSELVGKRIHNFVHPDDLTTVIQTVKKAFENRSGTKIESRIRHADGSYIVLEGIGKVLTDENGQIIGAVLNSRDITERKKAEEIVRDAEEKFRQLFNTMPSGVAVYKAVDDGDDFIFTDLNQTVEKIERVNKQDLLGKRVTKVFPGIEKFGLLSVFQRVFRTGQAEYFPSAIYRDKRTPESWRENWVYKLPNGNIVAVYNDITERKKIEQALSKSEEKYRKMFEEAIDAVFIADAETGIIIDCNRAATKLTGRAKSELIGMHQRFLHPPEEKQGEFSRTFEQHRTDKEGIVVETCIITKNGEIRDVAIKANLFEVNGKKMLRGLFRDITERKKVEEKISFQARLLNTVGQAVIATDTNGNITYWNRAAEQLYGWSKAEVLGRNIVEVTPADTSREQAKNMLNRLIAGESWSGEFLAKRRDGEVFAAIVTDAPIINDRGEFVGIVGVSTDITDQKVIQEVFDDAIGKVVELNEKLQVVGSLTRHDIRNKLSAVNGRIFLLKKRLGGNAEALLQLKEMELAAQQMLRILEFERIYEQVGVEELKYVNVEGHLTEAVSLFSDLKGVDLINECHGLMVLADSLLRQIFYNLIDNSLKYGEKISKIRVHYEEEEKQLKLIYEDNGAGIPEEIKSNLFNEGFGKGTGYGLYLMKRICETYGWVIQETSKHDQGAQFTMTIPKTNKNGKESYQIAQKYAQNDT